MADPDYVSWALQTAANNRAATQFADDQYAHFARQIAARQVAQGDYSDAASSLARTGDVANAQALQQGAARQQQLAAEAQGDITGARTAAAQTGVQGDYDAAQQGALQTAMQKADALNWLADHIASIPQSPGDATADPNTPRAKALNAALGTGMLQSMGMSHDALMKLTTAPLDDATLAAYRARIPFSGNLKGEGGVETVYAGGAPIAQGYTAPVKLDSGPGTSQEIVSPQTGATIAASTPGPVSTSPGTMLKSPVTGQPVGTQTPFEPKPVTVPAGETASGYDPNTNTFGAPTGQPQAAASPSPASAGMVEPGGAPGGSRFLAAHASGGVSAAGAPSTYAPLIAQVEQANGIPAGMLSRLIAAESGGDPNAVSPAGAVGVAQLMPTTAASLGVDPRDPVASIQAAGRYLAQNARQFGGDWAKAAAAYNAGPATVQRYGGTPPYPETQGFVSRVAGPQGGQPTGQGVASIQGAGYQPATMYGVKGMRAPNGDFTPTAGANVDFAGAAGGREKIYNNDEVKQAMASQAAYQALTANAGKMTGPAAYNILDTWIRTINPGRAATVGAIQAAGEQLGWTTEMIGKFQAAAQKGALPLNIQQQIIDGVLPFAQGHYDQAARVVKGYTDAARAYGGDQAANAVNVDLGARPSRFVIGQGGRPASARPSPANASALLAEARSAIQRGAPSAKVAARLQSMGVDPAGL